ncbi:amidohydrolase family protein [Gammaproteobacteria bacterium]|nr:amidohydrolase family protein [Gammaproteobacteria bacterium]
MNPVVCAATVDIFLSGISSGEDMLVICNVTAVTMDDRRRIIGDAGIAIDGQKIAAVDSAENIRKRYPDADLLDGAGMIAIPGLIDTHAHADQSLLRGLGDNMHWMPFLDDVVEPYLAKRDPADGVLANALSIMEMIHSGTTCFVSPNVDPRDDYASLTNVIGDLGIRAVLGRFTMPDAGPDSEGVARDTVAAAASVMHRWHATQQGLVSMWFGLMVPRRPGDTDHPAFYRAVANEAREMGVGIVYHFCSEIEDSTYIEDTYGVRPAEWSRDNHALGPNVLLINGCWVTPLEIQILAESGTHLAHSPVANMKMATGILPVPDVLAAGVNVSLGTDGALNNNSYDMFGEMKAACLLQNATKRSASALTAQTALEMATIRGARSIGREDELGSIAVGKLADIVLVDMRRPGTYPVHDVVSNLVFATSGSNVHTVFVAGKKILEAGRILGMNETEVLDKAAESALRTRRMLGLSKPGAGPGH